MRAYEDLLLKLKRRDEILVAGVTMGIVTILGIIIYCVGGWLHYDKPEMPKESLGIQEKANTGLHLCRIENINKK